MVVRVHIYDRLICLRKKDPLYTYEAVCASRKTTQTFLLVPHPERETWWAQRRAEPKERRGHFENGTRTRDTTSVLTVKQTGGYVPSGVIARLELQHTGAVVEVAAGDLVLRAVADDGRLDLGLAEAAARV